MFKEIIVCVTNKCPFCGKRAYSEGEDSIKPGKKIECETCGKKFEAEWIKNVEGTKEIPTKKSGADELLEIQKDCICEANKLKEMGLDMISRDLQSVSERIGDVLQLMWSGGEE